MTHDQRKKLNKVKTNDFCYTPQRTEVIGQTPILQSKETGKYRG